MDGQENKRVVAWGSPMGRLLLDPDPMGSAASGIPVNDPTGLGGGNDQGGGNTSDNLGGLNDTQTDTSAISTDANGSALVPADPNQAAGTSQQQAANNWQSIREAARAYGYDPGQQFEDDRGFLVHLLQQAQTNRQADFYARLGQQLAPHAQGIQGYLQQQQAPAQPKAPQPWEAPEFDERWLSLVDRDQATGVYLAKPGVPAEIAAKLNKFVEWKTNYDRNPAAAINGMVEQRAKEIAAQVVREQLQTQTQQNTIQSIVEENRKWMFVAGADGRPSINPVTQQPLLTPIGTRYMQHLQAVKGMGVTDPRHQDTLAKQLVRAEFFASQQQGQQTQKQTAADVQAQQAQARANTNPLQTQPPEQRRVNPAATEPTATARSLRDMLREEMQAEGVTDADFANIGG